MIFFFNTFILILILHFFLISIYGYGRICKNILFKNYFLNFGEIGVLGFISIYLTVILINFFKPINLETSFLILILSFLFGAFILIKNYKKKNILIYFTIFLLIILLSITNNLHDDAYWYHLPHINTIQSFKIIFGITNINHFIYGQSFYDIMSFFKLPYFGNKFVYLLPVIFLYFFLINIFYVYKKNKNDKNIIFFIIFITLIIFFRYSRSKEYGIDLPAQLLIIFFFLNCYFYTQKNNYEYFEKCVLFFVFGILTKLYFIFVIPFFFIFSNNIKFIYGNLINRKKFISFIISLILLFFLKNFINTGCFIYPLSKTCFNDNIIEWSSGKKFTTKIEDHLKANSKGYNTYTKQENNNLVSQEEYLTKYKYTYLKFWIKDKDIERLLFIFFIFIIILIPNLIQKDINQKIQNDHNKLIYYSIISLIISFLFGGLQSRYGGNMILAITLFSIGVRYNFFKINKFNKIYLILTILGILYTFNKNLIRINKEYSKLNEIDKLNYPINNFLINKYKINNKYIEKINITSHPIYCYNIPMLCTTKTNFNSISKIYKKKNYLIINSDENLKIESFNNEQNFITNEYYSK